MATAAQAASLSFIAERLMGLQMVVVGGMAIALFAMLRKRGENDAEGEDPMTVSEDDDDDGATAAERRVARASLAALGVGIFAAAIVYTTSYIRPQYTNTSPQRYHVADRNHQLEPGTPL